MCSTHLSKRVRSQPSAVDVGRLRFRFERRKSVSAHDAALDGGRTDEVSVTVPGHERADVEITEIKRRRTAERTVDIRGEPVQSPVPAESFLAVADAQSRPIPRWSPPTVELGANRVPMCPPTAYLPPDWARAGTAAAMKIRSQARWRIIDIRLTTSNHHAISAPAPCCFPGSGDSPRTSVSPPILLATNRRRRTDRPRG